MTYQFYGAQYSKALFYRAAPRMAIICIPMGLYYVLKNDTSRPQNDNYFRSLPNANRIYLTYQENMDLYKDVDDIKYEYKYPSNAEKDKVAKNIRERRKINYEEGALRYYREKYGVKPPKEK